MLFYLFTSQELDPRDDRQGLARSTTAGLSSLPSVFTTSSGSTKFAIVKLSGEKVRSCVRQRIVDFLGQMLPAAVWRARERWSESL